MLQCHLCCCEQTAPLTDAMMTLAAIDINGTRALINNATSFLSNISGLIDSQLSNFGN